MPQGLQALLEPRAPLVLLEVKDLQVRLVLRVRQVLRDLDLLQVAQLMPS